LNKEGVHLEDEEEINYLIELKNKANEKALARAK